MPPKRDVMFYSHTSQRDYQKALALYGTLDEEDKQAVKEKLQTALLATKTFLDGTHDYLSLNTQLGRLISSVVLPHKRLASGSIIRRDSLNIKALMEYGSSFEDIIPEGFEATRRELEQRITLSSRPSNALRGVISSGPHAHDLAESIMAVDRSGDDNAPPLPQKTSNVVDLDRSPESARNPLPLRRFDSMETTTGTPPDTATGNPINDRDPRLGSSLDIYQSCQRLLSQINECRLIPRLLNKSDRLMIQFMQSQKEALRLIQGQEEALLRKMEELQLVLQSVNSAEIRIINQCLNPLFKNMSKWNSWGNKDKIRRVEEALLNLPLLERGTAFSADPPTAVKEALLSYRVGLYKGTVPKTLEGRLDDSQAGKTYRQIVREIAASKLTDPSELKTISKRVF
jgi:hypothetical protein